MYCVLCVVLPGPELIDSSGFTPELQSERGNMAVEEAADFLTIVSVPWNFLNTFCNHYCLVRSCEGELWRGVSMASIDLI